MKGPDLDRERSERKLSFAEFLASYNEGLPLDYPRVSAITLKEFAQTHPDLFKKGGNWSLGQHRKKVMDWLPAHTRSDSD